MDRHARRVVLTLALGIVALCGAAPGALAATVSTSPFALAGSKGVPVGDSVAFVAAAGEVNAVTLTETADGVTLRDATATVSASPGCQQVDGHTVTCAFHYGPNYNRFSVSLGDGNDSVGINRSSDGTLLDGPMVDGGPGNDVLVGGPGNDSLNGGAGDDLLVGGAGDDLLEPGIGSDALDGGAGFDSAVYTTRLLAVSVDLSVPRADGATNPPDALVSIEGAIGGNGSDALVGNDGPNRLEGNDGADRLDGGGGADELIGWKGSDRILGGAGDDTIDLSVTDPEPSNPDDPYDSDFAVDRRSDRVSCGPGRDSVVLPEVGDRLTSDCELIEFNFIVLRRSSVRATRKHLRVRVDAKAPGIAQAIWVTIKRGGHTKLLGRSSPRAGTVRIRLNRAGRRLFANKRRHRIRIGDALDPDAGFNVTIRR